MDILLVGIGGAFGSIIRYHLGKVITEKSKTTLPWGTFIINITGAMLLGIVSNAGLNGNMYILFGDGFLGAYTTFSTFMYEGFNLFQENDKLNAFIYIIGSMLLGIFGFILGSELAGSIF